MTSPLRLGIAGIGTVGVGTIRIVQDQAALLKARTGATLRFRRSRQEAGVWIGESELRITIGRTVLSPWQARDDVDVFVELIGGADGVAKQAPKRPSRPART